MSHYVSDEPLPLLRTKILNWLSPFRLQFAFAATSVEAAAAAAEAGLLRPPTNGAAEAVLVVGVVSNRTERHRGEARRVGHEQDELGCNRCTLENM